MSLQTEIIAKIRKTQPAANLSLSTSPSDTSVAADNVGRLVMTMYQIRDLISTGSVTLTRGQEVAVISGVAGVFQDLLVVTAANTSANAIRVDLRYGTGGSVFNSIQIPANTTFTPSSPLLYPMPEVAQAITAQVNAGADISDSSVIVTMQAIQNI